MFSIEILVTQTPGKNLKIRFFLQIFWKKFPYKFQHKLPNRQKKRMIYKTQSKEMDTTNIEDIRKVLIEKMTANKNKNG